MGEEAPRASHQTPDNEGPHFEKVGFFSGILKSFEGSSNTSLKHFIILYPQTKNIKIEVF